MIAVTIVGSYGYRTEYIAESEIARISEAGPHSGRYRSIVRMKDGDVLECEETAHKIALRVQAEIHRPQPGGLPD